MSEPNITPLANWMSKQGVRDQWLADRLSCTQSQVSRIRRGINKPSVERAFLIEKLSRGKVKAASLLMPERA